MNSQSNISDSPLSVQCPTCGAKPSKPCRDPAHQDRSLIHRTRWQAIGIIDPSEEEMDRAERSVVLTRVVEGVTLRRMVDGGGWEGEYGGYSFDVTGPRSTGLTHTGKHWSVWVRPLDRRYVSAGHFSGTSLADAVQTVKAAAEKGTLVRNVEQWLIEHPV